MTSTSESSESTAALHDRVIGSDGPSIAVLAQIGAAMRGIRYGHVMIIVQDGVVVQIDRLEKHRLSRSGERQPPQG